MSMLESLSEYCGIVDSFVDARGKTRTTGADTKRALLAALGINAEDEAAAQQALARLRMEEAGRCLPPVHVHHLSSGPIVVKIGDPASDARQWHLQLEDGTVRTGDVRSVAARCAGGTSSREVRIDEEIPPGYHMLTVQPADARCSLIISPGKCWLPDGFETGGKWWGVAAQLYLLRSNANWGIGDFGDLQRLVRSLASRGADVVGLNPLHAMFPEDPEQASPYSPASRLLLNILNIDVDQVVASLGCEGVRTLMGAAFFKDSLAACRAAPLLDYAGVTALKLPILQTLFDHLGRDGPDWEAFTAFRASGGQVMERTCVFLALQAWLAQKMPDKRDWRDWPEQFRRFESPAVARFAEIQAEAVAFQAWLQFVADRQLQECRCAAAGMAVGLYRDLAVGAARGGAETWVNPAATIDGVRVGAPPDIYNPQGQNWGLPPFDPRALRDEGYRSFIDLVRANMRHAGGLRIDHVMGLQQLYWVPEGCSPTQGAYVRYPMEDLIGILALESHRHRCLIVGEDLGTVPAGFRERLQRSRMLSYRVLFFEKAEQQFIAPQDYPRLALAVAGSHDLPTLRAWWRGADIALKKELRLYPEESQAAEAERERGADRHALAKLMQDLGLTDSGELDIERFVDAAHALLARTSAAIAMLQFDDLAGEVDPVNVPTTSTEYPNWRRRPEMSWEKLLESPRFRAAIALVKGQRAASSGQPAASSWTRE